MNNFDVLISKSRFPIPMVISDSKSRCSIHADVACFRFRFPIPIRYSAIPRFHDFAICSRIRDFASSRFHDLFLNSRIRDSAISRFRDFAIPRFRDSTISRFRDFAIPRFRDSAISRFYPVSGKALHQNCRVDILDVRFSMDFLSASAAQRRVCCVSTTSAR